MGIDLNNYPACDTSGSLPMPNELPLVESRYIPVGQAILANSEVVLHPLDLLRLYRPDLTPVERVMVLVDRVYNATMAQINA